MIGGIEHGINTVSMGLYDGAHDLLGTGGYEKRQKELEKFDQQYMNLFTNSQKVNNLDTISAKPDYHRPSGRRFVNIQP